MSTSKVARKFTSDEWIDFVMRTMGYEPSVMDQRLKMLFLTRLIPLTERNYNLVELGPRGTGKSYAVQELSPYGALYTGPTTVANMFGHMTGKQKGMVTIWDVVAFDEVADLQKMPKEVITTLKTYCESGTFQRGKEADTGDASIAMFGNTNQPIDVMVQQGHLFALCRMSFVTTWPSSTVCTTISPVGRFPKCVPICSRVTMVSW